MNEAFKAWIEELEATTKKQGRGLLHTKDDELCCLGIGCQRAVTAGVISEPEAHDTPVNVGPSVKDVPVWRYDLTNDRTCPEPVWRWLGLRDEIGSFEPEEVPDELFDELVEIAENATPRAAGYQIQYLKDRDTEGMSLALLNDVGIPFPKIAQVARIVHADLLVEETVDA